MAKARTLVDNFNDNAIDPALWTTVIGSTDVRETNGRVEFRPFGNVNSGGGWYQSQALYDLQDSAIHVELVRRLWPVTGVMAFVGTQSSNYDSLQVRVNGGAVHCIVYTTAGGLVRVAELPYDPAHRWLRIRSEGDTVFWEGSPDCREWSTYHAAPRPFDLTAMRLQFGVWMEVNVPAPGTAVFDNFNVQDTSLSRRVEERRLSARDLRIEAAEVDAARLHDEHHNNNDEVNYPTSPLTGNFSKGLRHDNLGNPDPVSYGSLLRALESRDPHDFEEIILGIIPGETTRVKLTNPQAGLVFDTEGPDAQERTLPPAPRFDSQVAAHEMGELYWMAVARDIPFVNYGSDPAIAAAIGSLNNEFPQFGGTVPVTVQNVFRGIYPGEQVGPYVSQFLVRGNVDTRKQPGQGRDAADGFISYGSRSIDQRQLVAEPGTDWLFDFGSWLNSQNGVDTRGQDFFDTTRRFIRDLRGGTTFVHFDQVLDAYYNAAWILMSEPMGNQLTAAAATGRPQIDLEFPKDQGNPYDPPGTAMDSKTQVGFATFGQAHLLQTLGEVFNRALRAVWFQKWFNHRRLRPEEYGGRVDNQLQGRRTYPLHTSITTSLKSGALAPYYGDEGERFPISYLLPQAYPEGAPTHPAYGAGHATGSGALVTILKAFFDESTPIENPLQAAADGLTLVPYTGADAGQMTVGGELNKLAGNIALFRNAAGVHWRSDYTESLPLGEAIAIGLLQEVSLGFNEDDAYFQLTKFDGNTIRIFDGKVVPVV